MKQRKYFDASLLDRLLVSLARLSGVAFVTFVMLLCLPFLDSSQDSQEPSPPPLITAEEPVRVGVKLRRGETLASVLSRFGVEPPSARAITEKVRLFVNPKRIRPGDGVQVVLSPEDKTVQGLELVVDNNLVQVKATADGWLAERYVIPFVRDRRVIRGTIKESLYQSGVGAGLSPQHIADVAKIFEYDIDFFSDFRRGDAFSFVVEQLRYADGRRVLGRILAAELESGDGTFSTFYYVTRDGRGGYYDPEGRAARRSFLRAPLSYVRISSPFSFARQHPIFRTLRPHMAIDYAAPEGTPVVAIGRGQVAFVGWRRGYGNVVDILHSGGTPRAMLIFLALPEVYGRAGRWMRAMLLVMWDRPDTRRVPICTSNSCAAAKRSIFSGCGSLKMNVWRVKSSGASNGCARNVKHCCVEQTIGLSNAARAVLKDRPADILQNRAQPGR